MAEKKQIPMRSMESIIDFIFWS